ncbi:MAG TPA: D-hexose-6-phosphate mutarotase [Herbaspirillum sp.]|jgi:glucose-6-phosphate 1-epimerase
MSDSDFPAGNTPFPDVLNDMPGVMIGDAAIGSAFVAEQGAQVVSWRDKTGRERFYLSPISGGLKREAGSKDAGMRADFPAIRGGMPISFPQFSGRGALPKHGFVRNMRWLRAEPAAALNHAMHHAITMNCRDDAHTRQIWPQGFAAALTAQLQANRLQITLSVSNTGDTPWEFTVALHSYFRVEDVRNVRLHGLQGVTYQDATAGNKLVVESASDVTIAHELDRVYLSPPNKLTLLEPGVSALQIEQQGFADSVIWNPGPINAAALTDFPDDGWLHMLCVEAACAATPVHLNPGESWIGSQTLTVLD